MSEALDSIAFRPRDVEMGAYIPTPEQNKNPRRAGKLRLSGGQRDKMTVAMMKADMAALWRDGETYESILNIVCDKYQLSEDERFTVQNIQYHIKTMLNYWRKLALSRIDERQSAILARLDQIETLAIEGYFASLEGKKTTSINRQITRAKDPERKKRAIEANKQRNQEREEDGKRPLPLQADVDENMTDSLLVVADKTDKFKKQEENRAGDPKFLMIMFQINKERARILGLYNKDMQFDADAEAAKLTDMQREQRLATIVSSAIQRREKSIGLLAEPSPLGGFAEGQAPETPTEIFPVETVPEIEVNQVTEIEVDEDTWDFGDGGEMEWD